MYSSIWGQCHSACSKKKERHLTFVCRCCCSFTLSMAHWLASFAGKQIKSPKSSAKQTELTIEHCSKSGGREASFKVVHPLSSHYLGLGKGPLSKCNTELRAASWGCWSALLVLLALLLGPSCAAIITIWQKWPPSSASNVCACPSAQWAMDPLLLSPTNATLMSHVTNALLVVDEEKALATFHTGSSSLRSHLPKAMFIVCQHSHTDTDESICAYADRRDRKTCVHRWCFPFECLSKGSRKERSFSLANPTRLLTFKCRKSSTLVPITEARFDFVWQMKVDACKIVAQYGNTKYKCHHE